SPGRDFTVYYNDFDTVYFRLHNRLYTLHKDINEPKARLAEEVYKQHDGTKVCIISRKVRSYTFSWCLENVSFPPNQFKAYCDASSVGEDTSVRYTNVCPPELMSASCLYGLQYLGHNLRRWYPEEELKTNPLAQKACIEQLHGAWNK
uniref:hypothetical protein n=1 Tax=Sulfurovum sp. TaxID=1969726 RepID=UPI0025D8277E